MDETVSRVVERELGATPDDVGRLHDGAIHETYAVECAGEQYVVQFGGTDADEYLRWSRDGDDALERGLGCYGLLADTAIPVPEAVTGQVRELDGRSYVVVERVHGESGELAVTPERVRNAGRWLARIHDQLGFDRAGTLRFEAGRPVVDPFRAGGLEARVRLAAEESAATFRERGFGAAADAIESVADGQGCWLPETVRPRLCHGDYSPDNVVFDGASVAGVVDFDAAHAGHDQRDLVRSANAFWMHDPGADWDPRERFYEGYRTERDPGRDFERAEPAFRVLTLANVVSAMDRGGALSEDERAFYAGALTDAVERVGSADC